MKKSEEKSVRWYAKRYIPLILLWIGAAVVLGIYLS